MTVTLCAAVAPPTAENAAGSVPGPRAKGVAAVCADAASAFALTEGMYGANRPIVERLRADTRWVSATDPRTQLGLDAERLAKAAKFVDGYPTSRSLLVARDGDVLWEKYFHGGAAEQSLNVHSASKSIMQGLLSIALRDRAAGYPAGLKTPLAKIISNPSLDQRTTLESLVRMSSGLAWKELGEEGVSAETADDYRDWKDRTDWVAEMIRIGADPDAKPGPTVPGSTMVYSSANTHLVSAAIARMTGRSTCEYAQEKLFSPLGITPEAWFKDPGGVYSGGFNMHLTARELARFGQLYLKGGKIDPADPVGIVPAEAVANAPIRWDGSDALPPADPEEYDYGNGWWRTRVKVKGRPVTSYFADGYGGQSSMVLPALKLSVTVTQSTVQPYGDDEDNAVFLNKLLQLVIAAVR
ncbi:serine hydrolase [Pilimelia columellifera subsp. columellifera]|uniref:Serine hydrolase n=1 Tax=Pilimelia columellifera subsp. columellifera TaxID=706583 RepID=A0ABN3NLX1_9ACTN